ncbi:MAG: DUF1349 domain-containing protein [Muribaculaceae bacterium]
MKTPIIALALLMVVTSCGNADKNRQEAADPQNHKVMTLNIGDFKWTREPGSCTINGDTVTVVTKPHTDLWQRTYYHFRNDNAPVFQMETDEAYFSFVVKTDFSDSHHRFDQCGVVMYLDSDNWLKASVEYENSEYQHLGSVVTNGGYSDWATTAIDASVKTMWYRLSRREDDFCIECSADGRQFSQMRVCHLTKGGGKIQFGIYACSPEESTFKAVFTDMQLTECAWKAHDGQQPD